MTEDADRKELAARIDEFSRLHRGEIASLLEKTDFEYKTWRRAAQCIPISDVQFRKISAFLSEHSLVRSREETGIYSKSDLASYYGFYNLYRPNSVDESRIEVFKAKFEWDKTSSVAKVAVRNDTGSIREFIVHKPSGRFLFLRGAVKGWTSLYALDELWDCRLQDGEMLKVMTGVSVAMDYTDPHERLIHPVLFPIVLEKIEEQALSPYKQEARPSPAYDRIRKLLEIAVRGNISTIDVWSRFMMPGDANGGPRTP